MKNSRIYNIKQDRENTLWNLIAAIVQASQSVVVVMVVTRIDGLKIAGMITIAFSLANLFLTLGKFGMRNYQISHDGYDVDFSVFKHSRIITIALMVFVIIIYLVVEYFFNSYSLKKMLIISGICFWYVLDAFEDVYIATFQSTGRLDLGNKIFICRWMGILISFLIIEFLWEKILLAIFISCVFGLLIECMLLFCFLHKYKISTCRTNINTKEILIKNIPSCIAGFAYFYMTNIPRYIIDNILDDKTQAIYGYIAMPVFVISLLNNIIYQPKLIYFVNDIRNRNYVSLKKRINKQIIVIAILLVACLIIAYFIGIPILSWLYHTDLHNHKIHMLITLAGSAFLAVTGFLSTILVLLDKLKNNMFLFLITSAVGTVVIFLLVRNFNMIGAVLGFLIIMIFSAISFYIFVNKIIKKGNEEQNANK